MVRAAAGADRAAAQVWAQMRQEMLTAMARFAADLPATGQVRTSLPAEEVREVRWLIRVSGAVPAEGEG